MSPLARETCIHLCRHYISPVLRRLPFVTLMAPTLAKTSPVGPDWVHEVKFDGWRAQVHVEKDSGTIYSKNGADLTKRFGALQPVTKSSGRHRQSSTASSSPAMRKATRVSAT